MNPYLLPTPVNPTALATYTANQVAVQRAYRRIRALVDLECPACPRSFARTGELRAHWRRTSCGGAL